MARAERGRSGRYFSPGWRFVAGAVCLVLVAGLGAQPPALNLSFHHLSTADGLSQGTNSFIYRDSRGYVWLSSLDGLNRFDGRNVKTYKAGGDGGMVGNIVTSPLFEDEEGDLWFTTYEALHRYSRRTDRIEPFQLTDTEGDTIRQNYFAFHHEGTELYVRTGLGARGRLHLFSTLTGRDSIVGPIDGHRNYPVRAADGRTSGIVCANFFDRSGIGFLRMERSDTIRWLLADRLSRVFVVEPLTPGEWWLGSESGLSVYFPESDTLSIYDHWEGNPIGAVWGIAVLPDDRLLVSTSRLQLLVFDRKERRFVQRFQPEEELPGSLPISGVDALYLDDSNTLWLSSAREGVAYAHLEKRKLGDRPELRGQAVIAIFGDERGNVWTNGKAGLVHCFTPSTPSSRQFPVLDARGDPIRGSVEFFFTDEKGDLWLSRLAELYRWDESEEVFRYVRSAPNQILAVHRTRAGPVWLATYSGIFTLATEETEVAFPPAEALGDYQEQLVTAFFEDAEGYLYLAIDAARLAVLERLTSGYEEKAVIQRTGYAKSFHEVGDTLWVAGSNGVFRIDRSDFTAHWLDEATHGMPRDHFHAILPDDESTLWLSGERGIIAYFPNESRHRKYTLADGLLGWEYNTNAFLRDRSGRIWFGSNLGLTVFTPAELSDVSSLPRVQFADLRINDEPFDPGTQIGELEKLQLEYWENTISLRLLAMEYSDPTENAFRYRMVNYEDEWIESGTNDFIRYPNLSSGEYRLEVLAANSDGRWTDVPRTLTIGIATPWWESWWFYLICCVGIGFIAYGLMTYRLRQALKLERIRTRISSDLHDDVGSILTGLAMQSEVMELTAREENRQQLNRISEMSRSALSRMRDTVWAIDARKDQAKNLLDRVREHAEELLEPRDIAFSVNAEDLDPGRKLTSQIRQNLYLIIKEAITNAAKHTTGDRVTLEIMPRGRGLLVSIRDNGNPEGTKMKISGLGVSNMKMRAEQIGGTLEISHSNGFCVTVMLPNL